MARPEPPPDPLAEPEGPPNCHLEGCRSDCPCGKCHGHGWVEVAPGYAVRLYPDPSPDLAATLEAGDPDDAAAFWEALEAQRTAAGRSVYPCRHCRPALFFRWVGGHLAANHDPAGCGECLELLGSRAARRQSAVMAGTER